VGHSPRGREESGTTEHTQNEETWLTIYMSVCMCVCVPGMVVSLNLHHNIKCE